MNTLTEYLPGNWSVRIDGGLVGYISRTDDGQFRAMTPYHGNHKGGLSEPVGTYGTLEQAQTALSQIK